MHLHELFNQKWISYLKEGKINAVFLLLCLVILGGRCCTNTPPVGDRVLEVQEIAWIRKRT